MQIDRRFELDLDRPTRLFALLVSGQAQDAHGAPLEERERLSNWRASDRRTADRCWRCPAHSVRCRAFSGRGLEMSGMTRRKSSHGLDQVGTAGIDLGACTLRILSRPWIRIGSTGYPAVCAGSPHRSPAPAVNREQDPVASKSENGMSPSRKRRTSSSRSGCAWRHRGRIAARAAPLDVV